MLEHAVVGKAESCRRSGQEKNGNGNVLGEGRHPGRIIPPCRAPAKLRRASNAWKYVEEYVVFRIVRTWRQPHYCAHESTDKQVGVDVLSADHHSQSSVLAGRRTG